MVRVAAIVSSSAHMSLVSVQSAQVNFLEKHAAVELSCQNKHDPRVVASVPADVNWLAGTLRLMHPPGIPMALLCGAERCLERS
jgi:hypothetical protein